MQTSDFKTLEEFYPFYLTQHSNSMNRKLHVLGVTLGALLIILSLYTHQLFYFIIFPIVSYGCAWIGHFFFQKNIPATIKYPIYSIVAEFLMFYQIAMGTLGNSFEKYKIHTD